jgi:hypothetical protein
LHTFVGRFLFELVPLFRGIRTPARWAMIAYLGMAVLIAFGAKGIARRRGVVFARPGFTAPAVSSPPSMEGALVHPVHWEQISGALEVRGTMSSPRPIRKVLLYFDNRRTVFPAEIRGNVFGLTFRERPSSVRIDTDLQVELVDAAGERRRLPQVWLRWLNRGEAGCPAPLPQTADLGPYLIHPNHADDYPRTRPPR